MAGSSRRACLQAAHVDHLFTRCCGIAGRLATDERSARLQNAFEAALAQTARAAAAQQIEAAVRERDESRDSHRALESQLQQHIWKEQALAKALQRAEANVRGGRWVSLQTTG